MYKKSSTVKPLKPKDYTLMHLPQPNNITVN